MYMYIILEFSQDHLPSCNSQVDLLLNVVDWFTTGKFTNVSHSGASIVAWTAPIVSGSFLQFEFGGFKIVHGVKLVKSIIDYIYGEFFMSFSLWYSSTSTENTDFYMAAFQNGTTRVDAFFVTSFELLIEPPVLARFLRVYPSLTTGTFVLRWEVLGCDTSKNICTQ